MVDTTESMYFPECITIATTAAVASDYGTLSIVSVNLRSSKLRHFRTAYIWWEVPPCPPPYTVYTNQDHFNSL